MTAPGRCFGVGVGPGDPELMTLKAARLIGACPVIAYFHAVGRVSNARRVAAGHLRTDHLEVPLVYPVTTEPVAPDEYETLLIDFYDESAKRLAEQLDAGADVAVLCEGDPFFFGSFMYVHNRLADQYRTEVVPGVASVLAASAALGAPLACGSEVFTVVSGVLPEDDLVAQLQRGGPVVVMKLGRNLPKVRRAIGRAGLLERAHYVERVTMTEERVLPLVDADSVRAPYFSMVVVTSAAAPVR
jgi:precorrin-2/cobalt-factor-2 C20-methyltransferase